MKNEAGKGVAEIERERRSSGKDSRRTGYSATRPESPNFGRGQA